MVGAFWLLVLGWLVAEQQRRPPTAVRVLGVLATVAGVVATGWIVVTGHLGASGVWKGVL